MVGGPPKKSYQLVRGGTLLMLLPVSTIVLTGKKKVGGPPKMTYQLVCGGTLLILLPVSTIVRIFVPRSARCSSALCLYLSLSRPLTLSPCLDNKDPQKGTSVINLFSIDK